MTAFQQHCKKNPATLVKDTYEVYKQYYPEMEDRARKQQYDKELNELFFRKLK